ncbi:hypothetical protein RI054_35g134640 [Pseudoscourfieldia marina]
MAKGGGEPTVGSNKGSNKVKYKLNLVLKLFGGIATDDEVKLLKPTRGKENATSSDMGARLVLARSSTCLRWRFRDAYIDAKCPVPPRLQPINQHKLKASSWTFALAISRNSAKGLLSISTSRRCALGEASTMRRSTGIGDIHGADGGTTREPDGIGRWAVARSACEARWRAGLRRS